VKWIKTHYPGVFYREVNRIGGNGLERVYYIVLSPEQLSALIEAIHADHDILAANFLRLILCPGLRRGEVFKLVWDDIDFDRGFIHIRHNPKGGKDQTIPMNLDFPPNLKIGTTIGGKSRFLSENLVTSLLMAQQKTLGRRELYLQPLAYN
jgi:integrase